MMAAGQNTLDPALMMEMRLNPQSQKQQQPWLQLHQQQPLRPQGVMDPTRMRRWVLSLPNHRSFHFHETQYDKQLPRDV